MITVTIVSCILLVMYDVIAIAIVFIDEVNIIHY